MILAIFIPILIYGGALLVGSALGAGGIYVMGRRNRASRQEVANNVLPLSRSGNNRYPASHDVFTSNSQDLPSYSTDLPANLNFNNHLDSLNGNYRDARYGSEYMRLISQNITDGGANQSIRRALVDVSNDFNNRLYSEHIPLHRLGDNSNINDPVRDFEVLVITGSPNYGSPNDSRRFQFDAAMLGHAVRRTYGARCGEFQTLNDPNRTELEAAIIARTQSARRNNRRLYITYRGHGSHDGYQAGVATADLNMQGSRRFVFELDRAGGFNEDHYKNLLNIHARDLHVTSIFGACHSGAAITATDPFFRRNIGAA